MSILVLNAGSSTLKFGLFEPGAREPQVAGNVDWDGPAQSAELIVRSLGEPERRQPCEATDHRSAASLVIKALSEPGRGSSPIRAVGHRIVHGGQAFVESVLVTPDVAKAIASLSDLAPLHNPQAVAVLETATASLPGLPHVAVFDTSFFAGLPRSSAVFPVPFEWYKERGIRRFGFHGISHSYCAGRAAEVLGRTPEGLRLVICHLGNGCSAAAVRDGRAVDTTMGYTPLDGLMMGTRAGAVDPGILLHLQQREGFTAQELDHALNHQSGLLGVSGVSSDFRKVEAASLEGNDRARLALEIYAARIRSAIGALSATLGGLDALVFTAGVGENSARLRTSVCEGLRFLGIELDPQLNAEARPDADIAQPGASIRVLILHTREELMIARETGRLALKQNA
ncbi:acetate/propionate family kinase [Singulisphaera sp. PoT]|uniref:acetate/propionate family kinase n=1 Tax=Singulisphaera sp. PoT TaxID=3411797 RepID=UPI003BF5494B